MVRQVEPIAVVMTCYRYGHWAAECLESIAAQTLRPAEVLVLDDGSDDDSPQVLRKLERDLADRLPLRVVEAEHRGPAPALRAAIAATSAPWVVNVDMDDVVRPRFLEALGEALAQNAEAGYAWPRMRLFGAETGSCLTHPFSPGRLIFQGNYIPNVALMRRAAYESTPGHRDLPTHIDWDLWLSFLDAGWPGVLVDEDLYLWRRHGPSVSAQPQNVRLATRRAIMRAHRGLVVRHAGGAIPWTTAAVARRVRQRLPEPLRGRARMGPSGWYVPDAVAGSGQAPPRV